MRNGITTFLALCLATLGWGEVDEPLLTSVQTNLVIESETVEQLGWSRQTLFATPDGQLIDRSGVIVSAAEAEAVAVAAGEVGAIAEAAHVAVTNATTQLLSATNDMARAGYGLYLSVAPDMVRSNLTGYVVKETSNGTVDTQWVWYNYTLSQAPVRWVEYQGEISTNSVKAVWEDWDADGETITYNGRTWEGCHKCTVVRPIWAKGERCCTLPNEIFGGENGFDIGDCTITIDGAIPATGYFTNTLNSVVEYYNNGLLMEIAPL